jgi:hypothetical protein
MIHGIAAITPAPAILDNETLVGIIIAHNKNSMAALVSAGRIRVDTAGI